MTYLFANAQEIKNDIGNPIPVVSADGSSFFGKMQLDAFGRLRVSQPYTLFDSFHRYQDNGKINQATNNGTVVHNPNTSSIECTVNGTAGAYVKRESSRVFSYQPGKSLQIIQTYVMNAHKTGLRQRYGYFGEQNGYFIEQSDLGICFVERSYSTGSLIETRVFKSNWNYDKLDGTGISGFSLDLSKAQIQFIDIEWLGCGSVRCGFVIAGQFCLAHTFHHANILTNTYMTTACLPVRAEIENVTATSGSSTLKIICASVMSEGGYEVSGRPQSIGHNLATPYNTGSPANTLRPLITMRLKSNRLDAVVLPKLFNIVPIEAIVGKWVILQNAVTSGGSGTWVSAGPDSSVEYKLDATTIDMTNAKTLETGFIQSTSGSRASIADETAFKYQLERNSFVGMAYEITLALQVTTTNKDIYASIAWEEST